MPRSFRSAPLLAAALASTLCHAQAYKSWADYGGSPDSAQYSALAQVDRGNVSKLQVAWSYSTGDDNKYFFNPLVAGGRVYVLAKNNSGRCSDPESGRELWTHTAEGRTTAITNRGLNYWASSDGSDERLLFCRNHYLVAVDARTGKLIPSFGTNGRVDLKQGLDRDPASLRLVQSLPPGRVFENLFIVGSATNQGYTVRHPATSARSISERGKLVWTFHTIPRPGEFGYDTWPKDAWKTVGGANVWSEFTVDPKRGILLLRPQAPSTTSMARTEPAITCSPTACSHSTLVPANASGISRWFTTTSGITTMRLRRSC